MILKGFYIRIKKELYVPYIKYVNLHMIKLNQITAVFILKYRVKLK